MSTLQKRLSTDSIDTTSSGDSDQSLGDWLVEIGLSHLQPILNSNGIYDIVSLTDASLNNLPFITAPEDKDALLYALQGADLNQDLTEDKSGMPVTMDTELDDIMDQFMEMEKDLDTMIPGDNDTVKLRKKKSSNTSAYRMSIMALGNTDDKDLDSLLDDLCNDVDDLNSSFTFNNIPSPSTPKVAQQFDTLSVLPPPLTVSSESLPPPPVSFSEDDEVPGTPGPPDLPPPPAEDQNLIRALDDLEADIITPPSRPVPQPPRGMRPADSCGSLPPPPAPISRSVSPLPAPPPPCVDDTPAEPQRPLSLVSSTGRPASLISGSDLRNSICTTSSGTSSQSTPSSSTNQRESQYTMSTTPHSTLSKSSGVSSYLSSSSSGDMYNSKMSLSSIDYRENDYKSDPLNVPIRVPDTEPLFIDSVSPEPTPTTPITPGPKSAKIQRRLTLILKEQDNLTEEEKAALLKKEKLKIALEKLRVASNLKIAMKAYNVNNSAKTIWVEQKQSTWDICQTLAEKNHFKPGTDWTLVEYITDLQIERELEDHENVYDVLNSWSRDSSNKMYFRNNARKYELFRRPQLYLHQEDTYANVVDLSRECRNVLIEDFFSGTANTRIPSIGLKGVHWLKSGKKSWRKMHFVIRDSGIYYAAKAKNKTSALPWTSFCRIDENDIFLPANYKDFKKQHKAPTEYCFLIRTKTNTRDQHRSTRCICVENELHFRLWTNALRRLAFGSAIKQDYDDAMVWLQKLNIEQGDLQRACLSPTLQQSFKFDSDRQSIILPNIDDDAGDIFGARFNAAWNNSDPSSLTEAPSLFDLNLETDTQGMTMVRLHK